MKRTALFFTIIALFVISGCGKKDAAEVETETVVAKITNVETYTITSETFEDYLTLPVVSSPDKQVNLGLVTGGKVTKINVDKGDRVKKGAVLLETDDVLLKANLEIARANLDYQKNELARSKKLFDQGSITEAAFDGSKLQHAQSKNAYDIAQKQLDDTILRAPFSGMVTIRNVENGDILGPGSPAFRIIDMSKVKIQTGIPEKYVGDFKVGNTVTITIDAIPGKTFDGKVNYISPEASPQVRTFLAEILVNNQDGSIMSGTMGNAKILRKVYENALMIPINAMIETQKGLIVFVLDNSDIVRERDISSSVGDDLMVMIDGLSEGEKIISKGQYDLVDGEKVNVTGEYSPADGMEGL